MKNKNKTKSAQGGQEGEKTIMKLKSFFSKMPKGLKALLAIAVLAIIVLGILWLTTKAGTVTITSIDGQAPVDGGILNPISETPTFTGTADPGALVSVYSQTTGEIPIINKVAGEDDLSLTYQPATISDFSDDFNDGNWNDKWDWSNSPPSEHDGKMYLNGSNVGIETRPTFSPQSFSIQAEISTPQAPPKAYFDIGIHESFGPGQSLKLEWVNDPTLGSEIRILQDVDNSQGTVNPGQAIQSISYSAMTPGQTYIVKLTYDINTNTVQGFIDGASVISAVVSSISYSPRVMIGIRAGSDSSSQLTIDNLNTNFPFSNPTGYLMARTGMSLDGVSYMDPALVLEGATGVVYWGQESGEGPPVPLPMLIPGGSDIYVYLTEIDFTVYGGGPEKWTIYSDMDPTFFSQIVAALNGGAIGVPIPTTVDAFAKVFTISGTEYISETLPLASQGQIIYNASTGQAEIVPAGGGGIETLIAKTIADENGYWTAFFGYDELGSEITDLIGKTLLDIGTSPFTFIARSATGESSPVVASVVPPITDEIPPITIANVIGIAEDTPFSDWYKDTAAVTLTATDEEGGSGVAKTEYSLSGATTQALTTYTTPFDITNQGETTVTYYSTNNAGNIEGAKTETVKIDKDTDGDDIYDNFDKCSAVFGNANYDGCPYAIDINSTLHVNYVGTPKFNQKLPVKVGPLGDPMNEEITSVEAKVYKLSDLGNTYGNIQQNCGTYYDSTTATPVNVKSIPLGTELLGVATKDNYVVMQKVSVLEPQSNITGILTTCRNVDVTKDFSGNISKKEMPIMKTVKNGKATLSGGQSTVMTGSMLEIIYPENVLWEEGINSYVYTYIFTSDSDWNVDVCTYTPEGYQIAGVYDENGALIGSNNCTQTFISGQPKVIAFEVIDIGSPKKFNINTDITAGPKDKKAKKLKLNISTERVNKDRIIAKNTFKDLLRNMKNNINTQEKEGLITKKEEKGLIKQFIDYIKNLL